MSPARTVELPTPFPHQADILLDGHRIKVPCLGRQSGKTLMGSIAVLDGHGPMVDGAPLYRGALHGEHVTWATKDYPTSTRVWRDIKYYLRLWGGPLEKSEMERRIEFPGGGSLTIKSASDPDSLRGDTIGGLVGDEVAFWHPDSLNTLRPALAVRRAWQMLISTPYGFNFYHDEFRKGHEGTDPDYRSWQLPSSCNPAFPAEEFEKAKARERPAVWAREYLAEFAITEGEIFRRDWFRYYSQDDKSITPEIGEAVEKASLQTYMAADFALTKQDYSDYTAIAIVSAAADGRMFVRDLMRVKVSRGELPALMKRLQDRWGARFCYAESSGKLATLNEECRRAGVLIVERKIHQVWDGKKGEDKVTRAYEGSKAVELGRLMFPKARQANGSFAPPSWVGDVISECCAFPESKNDDMVDAVSLSALAFPLLKFRGEGGTPEGGYKFKKPDGGDSRWWSGLRRE